MADVKVRIIAVDEASEPLKKTGEEVEKVGKKAKEAGGAFEGLGKTMVSVAGGLGLQMGLQAIIGGLKNAVVGSFELAAALEQTKVGFTTMLGSGEAAQGMLDELRDFAATTPFQFQDLTKAASRMIAMGTAAEDVIPTLTAVGDAAAGLGLGSAGVDRITLALGQMGAKGKIGGDDLRQLAEAGVPALRYLADAAGVSTAEMSKMIEKGIIPAADGVKVLTQSMEGDFGGLMAEQAKTATGALSNLEDATATLGTQIGEIMVPSVTKGATELSKFFNVVIAGQTAMNE
ncbi:MAG: tape measure protein, partial [Burkholderiales bacterium]|nr:tape measure protein [Burkholderiales bacterium]